MPNPSSVPNPQGTNQQEGSAGHRNAWILTAYGIFLLGLLCLIAYAVAEYLASS
jgi:hypothetical protein